MLIAKWYLLKISLVLLRMGVYLRRRPLSVQYKSRTNKRLLFFFYIFIRFLNHNIIVLNETYYCCDFLYNARAAVYITLYYTLVYENIFIFLYKVMYFLIRIRVSNTSIVYYAFINLKTKKNLYMYFI